MKLFNNIIEDFLSQLSNLKPINSYSLVKKHAQNLSKGDMNSIKSSYGIEISEPEREYRTNEAYYMLNLLYQSFAGKELDGAKSIAFKILNNQSSEIDVFSMIDALHVLGRIEFERENFDEAESYIDEVLRQCEDIGYAEGFVRAVHEKSRINKGKYNLIDAEVGFRLCMDYYASKCFTPDGQKQNIELNSTNLQMAINYLGGVGDTLCFIANGPTEGDDYIKKIDNKLINIRDGSADEFLFIHSMGILGFISEDRKRYPTRLIQKACKLHATFPHLSQFAMEESEYAESMGFLKSDHFTYHANRVLFENKARELSDKPLYFNYKLGDSLNPKGKRYNREEPAESIAELMQYLKSEEKSGYYVYRGQTEEYMYGEDNDKKPYPLFPSAFRGILTKEYGMDECLSKSSPLYDRYNLRKCGNRFYGEYNKCFLNYRNPLLQRRVSKGVNNSSQIHKFITNETEITKIIAAYKKILDDPFVRSHQQRQEKFLSWEDNLKEMLSGEEYGIYQRYKGNWELLINNYHKRLLRMNIFIHLFGYVLGTTFAQQYGFASEGLDATTSIDVASFFATHLAKGENGELYDAPDSFRSVKKEGIGIIYRFKYNQNTFYADDLEKYNYYNLPSIIDLRDVYYRFETAGLNINDSLDCFRLYFGASFIEQFRNINMFYLPENFFKDTRISRQEAVIIMPDEIREDETGRKPGTDGIVFPKYRYLEDLSTRDGVEKFYFKHTGEWPAEISKITREYLWPRSDEDHLLNIIFDIVVAFYPDRNAVPQRFDLIDSAFNKKTFIEECIKKYEHYSQTILFDEAGLQAIRFGSLLI